MPTTVDHYHYHFNCHIHQSPQPQPSWTVLMTMQSNDRLNSRAEMMRKGAQDAYVSWAPGMFFFFFFFFFFFNFFIFSFFHFYIYLCFIYRIYIDGPTTAASSTTTMNNTTSKQQWNETMKEWGICPRDIHCLLGMCVFLFFYIRFFILLTIFLATALHTCFPTTATNKKEDHQD